MTDRSEPDHNSRIFTPATPVAELTPEPGPAGKEFVYVDENRLMVSDTSRLTRWWLTIPMAFAMLTFPILHIRGIISGYYKNSQSWTSFLKEAPEAFGEHYIPNLMAGGRRPELEYAISDGHVSFGEYMRYLWVDIPGGWQHQAWGIGFSLVFIIAAIVGFSLGFGGRRRPRLIFDRERQAIYTWLFGTTMAVPWDSARVAMRPTGVSWLLMRDHGGTQEPEQVPSPVYLGASALSPALDEWKLTHCGRVAAFMADGMSAIEDAPFSRKDPFSLREDPIPPNGMELVDELLARLRSRA